MLLLLLAHHRYRFWLAALHAGMVQHLAQADARFRIWGQTAAYKILDLLRDVKLEESNKLCGHDLVVGLERHVTAEHVV